MLRLLLSEATHLRSADARASCNPPIVRHRSSYYKERGVLKLVRKFFIRYKSAGYIVVLFPLSCALFGPMVHTYWKSSGMSLEEKIDFRNKHNAVVNERLKTGSYLYFPFLTKDHAKEHDDTTQKIFSESTIPPTRVAVFSK